MVKKFLLLTFCILSFLRCSYCSTFKLNFEHNNINNFHNLFKNIKKKSICTVSSRDSRDSLFANCTVSSRDSRDSLFANCTVLSKDSLNSKLTKIESRANKKLQKYKPLYKIIYKLQLMTTIRFKSLLIIFIFLRTISSLYNNINDIVSIINLIDEKDIKDIKKVLELLSFINFINIFNIVTFLELYDITENLDLINKKLLLYKKYVRLYKKDCFIINYI